MTDHDTDDVHDAEQITLIEANQHGWPCFGCYFAALLASLTPAQLTEIEVDEEEAQDPQAVEFARRFGAAMAYVADSVAALAVDAAGENAGDVHQAFLLRLRQMLDLHQAPVAPLAH